MATSMKHRLVNVFIGWCILFCCWLVAQALIPNSFENSLFYKIVSLCIMPGVFISIIFGPGGHDLPAFITGMILSIIVSVGLYVSVAWVLMNVSARHQPKGSRCSRTADKLR